MFRSLSHHFFDRTDPNYLAAHTDSIVSDDRRGSIPIGLFGRHPSIKKAFSLIFHRVDSALCHSKDDNEMHEFIRCSTSEENLNSTYRTVPTGSPERIINQQPGLNHSSCRTVVHERLSRWKNKFRHRYEPPDQKNEKNDGYLMVMNPESEPVLVPNDTFDHQQTQHAQPCMQINDLGFDLNQIQYSSFASIVSPQADTTLGLYLPSYNINLHRELDFQSTRSSVECSFPQDELPNGENNRVSTIVAIASPSSTNSSIDEYHGVDRSTLDDAQYVRAQEYDLFRLIDMEIDLSKEMYNLQQDLEEEEEFNRLFEVALQENLKLKDDLRVLHEQYDPHNSPWSCELCTFINKSFNETGSNICEVCEGPSPSKRAALIQ